MQSYQRKNQKVFFNNTLFWNRANFSENNYGQTITVNITKIILNSYISVSKRYGQYLHNLLIEIYF